MARLDYLRRRVLIELGDFEQKRADEADLYLNVAQDEFHGISQAIRLTSTMDIVTGTAKYDLTAAAGYEVLEVLTVMAYDGARWYELDHRLYDELLSEDPDWLTRTGRPEEYLRDIDPLNNGTVAANTLFLMPEPTADVTGGLKVLYAAKPSQLLTADSSTTLLPKHDQALIDFAVAKMGHPDKAALLTGFYARAEEARGEAERGGENHARRVRPYDGRGG